MTMPDRSAANPGAAAVDQPPTIGLDPELLRTGLDPDGVVQALQPFGRSRMLPAAAYTSAEVLAWERRHLFAGTWCCVGRTEDLRTDGVTQRAVTAGDVAVLLTFDADADSASGAHAAPRAFANTCRHRGHELLPDGQTSDRRSIVCPYHAWTYRLSGRLHAAPGLRENADFRPDDHGLVELPVHTWQGWVFVHAATALDEGGAPVPFETHVGDMDALVSAYDVGSLALGARHTYVIEANWKVVTENYHECYHCPLIHPELCQVTPPTSGDNYDRPGAWVGGSMELRDGMTTMSLTGASSGAAIPGAPPGRVEYLGLFPNLLVSAHPDYVMAHRLQPLTPTRTAVECSWYFFHTDPPVDPGYAVDFWDLTNRQDWAACESVQRGLASPHFRPGPFAPNEDAVHQFVSMVARAYCGESPHAG